MLQLDMLNKFKHVFVPINLDTNALAPVTLDVSISNVTLTDKVVKVVFVETNVTVNNLTVLDGIIKLPVQNTSLAYGINTVQLYIGTEKAPLIIINVDSRSGHYTRKVPVTDEDVQAAIDAIPEVEVPEAVPQVNADWNAGEGSAEILNKPELLIPYTTGFLTEDFEDTNYSIPFTGQGVRANDDKHTGGWSLKQDCNLRVDDPLYETIFTLNVEVEGNLEFWYKRTNEVDAFINTKFILDDVVLSDFTGARGWTKFSTPITIGEHVLKIRQVNQAGSVWWTKLWIDNMSFPSSRVEYPNTPAMNDNGGKIVAVKANETGWEYKAIPKGGISFFVPGDASVGQNKVGFVCPCAMTIVKCIAKVTTAPTGASLIADVHKNGTTIFTTQANRPTIAAAGTSVTTAAPDVVTLEEGDFVTLDIDQIGSTIAGANLAIVVEVLPVLS